MMLPTTVAIATAFVVNDENYSDYNAVVFAVVVVHPAVIAATTVATATAFVVDDDNYKDEDGAVFVGLFVAKLLCVVVAVVKEEDVEVVIVFESLIC